MILAKTQKCELRKYFLIISQKYFFFSLIHPLMKLAIWKCLLRMAFLVKFNPIICKTLFISRSFYHNQIRLACIYWILFSISEDKRNSKVKPIRKLPQHRFCTEAQNSSWFEVFPCHFLISGISILFYHFICRQSGTRFQIWKTVCESHLNVARPVHVILTETYFMWKILAFRFWHSTWTSVIPYQKCIQLHSR